MGYDKSESDILLLDISNDDLYIWTNSFDPSMASVPVISKSTASPSSSATNTPSDKLLINKPTIIGAIVGSLFVGILLSFGGFLLYKWNKNRRKQKNTLLRIPGNGNQA